MIKFFKNIRHETLTDNPPDGRAGKFSKYPRYAFGEILLVVIGILIALQINNWNENRKASLLEIVTLRNLKEDLIYNASKIKTVYSNDSLTASRNNTKLLGILKDRYSV